ncbi:hypothetical protein [Marinobacter metalliresistant]|uniref:Uncharacterized protein n=1 Tax=Marinobacter metalliresistant TaxID=2961995 RepID=A0ABZ2VXY4_9GAMM
MARWSRRLGGQWLSENFHANFHAIGLSLFTDYAWVDMLISGPEKKPDDRAI